jgi:hypothetical protein
MSGTKFWSDPVKFNSIFLFLFLASGAYAAPMQDEIDHLLQYLSESGCSYVRNGSEHSAQDAVGHIRKKADYYEDDIDSTERFIELSASRSTISGRSYTIRCPGLPEQDANTWLSAELARYRSAVN